MSRILHRSVPGCAHLRLVGRSGGGFLAVDRLDAQKKDEAEDALGANVERGVPGNLARVAAKCRLRKGACPYCWPDVGRASKGVRCLA